MAKEVYKPNPAFGFVKSYLQSLRSSVERFRKGEDHNGLEMLLKAIEDFEKLLGIDKLKLNSKEMNSIIREYKNLLICIRNRDVLGITDLLEYTLYPMSEQLLKGVGK